MDKDMLFRFMRTRFREAGFTPDEINLHIANFNERYKDKTDDEIEADMMRRGGPSRMVARVIEQRNSVLMKDAEYRAFVEGQNTEGNDTDFGDDSASDRVPSSVQASVSDEDDDVRTYAPKTESRPQQDEKEEEDPLKAWFSDAAPSDSSKEDEALTAIFRTAEKSISDRPSPKTEVPSASVQNADDISHNTHSVFREQEKNDDTPTVSAVHTIPLFEDPPSPKPQNTPPRRSVPIPEQDMSRTRVMRAATAEQHITGQNRPNQTALQQNLFAPEAVSDTTASRQPVRTSKTTGKPKTQKQIPAFLRLPEITYWGEGTEEGVRRFRILFAVSLPFVILLLAAVAVLLLGITLAVVAMIIFLVIALVVEVAVGSIISLIGIIYGISQLFLVLPIGMFELGLGISAVGLTILAGILIYNLAVRFLPFILRQLYRFVGFLRYYIQDLYYYAKGECYRR